MQIDLEEGERQVIILALAKLSLSRPGWHPACLAPLAKKFGGEKMYETLRCHGPDALPPTEATDPQMNDTERRRRRNSIGRQGGYGGCRACGDTWDWKKSHTTSLTESSGCFPLCEECWKKMTIEERIPHYMAMADEYLPGDQEQRLQIAKAVREGK